uniref:Nucleotidyl transferase domain-containing protein n=1 Tax=Mantoniella antarctica TaxID=81844 RepID=A0A7S0SYY9_9CHLO
MAGGYVPVRATVKHVQEAELPKETLKVVILNGGFSAQLTHDIVVDTISTRLNKKATDAKSGAGGDAKRLGSHTSILRGRLGKEYVNAGLVKVNNTTFLEHLFIMLRKCERLHLPRDLFIVGNDSVRTPMDEWCSESDVSFPVANIVYNGLVEDTRAQQSDVADLALAIDTFDLAACQCPLLVITADQIFFQDFHFTRILEHSVVRNKDVVATYNLTPGQVVADPNGAPIVTLLGDQNVAMGKIKSVALDQMVDTGRALAPIMCLHRSTVSMVRGFRDEERCQTLHELFKAIVEKKGGEECYVIDLGFGRFDCITLESLRYCEEFQLFYTAQKLVLNRSLRTQDTDSNVDFKTSPSRRPDAPKRMNQLLGYGDMLPDMTKAVQTFIKIHFEERTAALSGKMNTLTPSNFYQTEYTRNTPAVKPRPAPLGRSLG